VNRKPTSKRFVVTRPDLPPDARKQIVALVGKRGDAAALIADIDKLLFVWSHQKRRAPTMPALRREAASLQRRLAGISPDLRRMLNGSMAGWFEVYDLAYGIKTSPEKQRDLYNPKNDWLKNLEGSCESVRNATANKSDLFGASIVRALSCPWLKHTTLKPSASPDSVFVGFVLIVLRDCSNWPGTDPRRLITSALRLR
jgi:hypothetical protein